MAEKAPCRWLLNQRVFTPTQGMRIDKMCRHPFLVRMYGARPAKCEGCAEHELPDTTRRNQGDPMASDSTITVTIVTDPEFLTFEQAAQKFADLVFAAIKAGADPPSVQMEPVGSSLLLRTITTTANSRRPIEVRIIGLENGDDHV